MRRTYYTAKFAVTIDPNEQKKYAFLSKMYEKSQQSGAKHIIEAFQQKQLGFFSAPLLYLSWRFIQAFKKSK
jgi:hypothetical protein